MAGLVDRYRGVGVGLVIGDAHCAPYEGGPLERGLWRLIGRTGGKRRFTDDSQMAFDLGWHLVRNRCIAQQELVRAFAKSCRWSRGYGPSTVAVLNQIKRGKPWTVASTHKYRDGSFGNGAAMRIAPLAVFMHRRLELAEVQDWVRQASEVTHPNQLAIDGANAIASCIVSALDGIDPEENVRSVVSVVQSKELRCKLDLVREWILSGDGPSPREAKQVIGSGAAATASCPVAIYIGLKLAREPLTSVLTAAKVGGGDTDTIGAMGGAIWGAYNGYKAIPGSLTRRTEGVDEMLQLVGELRAVRPKE